MKSLYLTDSIFVFLTFVGYLRDVSTEKMYKFFYVLWLSLQNSLVSERKQKLLNPKDAILQTLILNWINRTKHLTQKKYAYKMIKKEIKALLITNWKNLEQTQW